MKARLRKVEDLTHSKIKQNISNVIRNIPKEKYENIFKGAYNRNTIYVKIKQKKNKNKKYLKYSRRFKCPKVYKILNIYNNKIKTIL